MRINFDLYIHKNDLNRLEQGDEVTGYKQVSNPENFELINKYAFLPAQQINENEYLVCVILK